MKSLNKEKDEPKKKARDQKDMTMSCFTRKPESRQ